MAGVVAMASVIEDFDTQPCKKQRKDGETPPSKTIANYFLPVPKPVEKPFSPPRSNNIRDYFRKTLPTVEQSGENRSSRNGAQGSPDPPAKNQRLKRNRKPGRKAQDGSVESPLEVVSETSSGSSNGATLAGEPGKSLSGTFGSDTGAVRAQLSAEPLVEGTPGDGEISLTVETCPKECARKNPQIKNSFKWPDGDEEEGSACSLQRSCKEPAAKAKAGSQKHRKAKGGSLQGCFSEVPEPDRSLCEASLEVHVDEVSRLNDSTVTISFEDFLQSQNQEEDSTSKESAVNATGTPCVTAAASSETSPSQQVSPRTLTVRAEVHPISPRPELARTAEKRLASIFSRRSQQDVGESKAAEPGSPNPELPLVPKRKSNVVLPEEKLELAVIESCSAPKCSQAERKQFMNAFRQPGVEAVRSRGKRVSGKQEEAAETAPAPAPDETQSSKEAAREERDPSPGAQTTEQGQAIGAGEKGGGKLRKRGRKEGPEQPPAPAQTLTHPDPDCPGTANVQRTTRALSRKGAPVQEEAMRSPLTRRQERLMVQGEGEDASTQVSTPKAHRCKRNVYRAEMLSPPDNNQSPIRMRFRRVFPDSERKSGDGSDFEILSPLAAWSSGASKSRKRAKRLVQKAKSLQLNKNKAPANGGGSLRRSQRKLENGIINLCEDEDSVVCVEDASGGPTRGAQGKAKGPKRLRSLNEVLGKSAAVSKAAKSGTASRTAPVFLGKKAQKPLAVISIFDDSSREGSENSQDDEQFRARREFLKSGLPESLRKQVSRATASRDAYSLACASFQPVVHVLQKLPDCPLWSLPWPTSTLVKPLKESGPESPKPVLLRVLLDYDRTLPAQRLHTAKVSGWREDFSEQDRKGLLEEVRLSDPLFPVQKFFAWFLKRRAEHLLQSEPEVSTKIPDARALPELASSKRKRRLGEEGEEKVSKRRRSGRAEPIVTVDCPSRGAAGPAGVSEPPSLSRLSRTQRNKRQETGGPAAAHAPTPNSPIIVLEDTPPPGNAGKGDGVGEDVLWTEKYQPQHSSQVVGNASAVRKLHSWLREWKLRADCEEKRNQRTTRGADDSWDCHNFQGEDGAELGEELLCNTLLITGPPGVGKTAAVYACAQELGFKVFEVNASSQRSGRQILSQLKEATQSHQVELQGVNAHKPSYFNNYSANAARCGPSPRKVNTPRKVVSSPRRPPQSPRHVASRRGGLAPTSLANFFKVGRPPGGNSGGQDVVPQTASSQPSKVKENALKSRPVPSKPPADRREASAEEQSKKSATSLILFEEVDVIFDDDSGFLAAIKTFMTTTKRPVILTTSDPTFCAMFDGYFEEIHFETPSVVTVGSYLRLLCLAENVRTDAQDLSSLVRWNSCDIRRSLLHLQFWVRGGGGRASPRPLPPLDPKPGGGRALGETAPSLAPDVPATKGEPPAGWPHCDVGSTESLLGLLNIEPGRRLPDLYQCKTSADGQRCWELLTESWKRGVDLLYSNMEELLPLPVGPMSAHAYRPHHVQPQVTRLSDDDSPVKAASRIKRRKRSSQTGKNVLSSDSDSDSSFQSLSVPPSAKPGGTVSAASGPKRAPSRVASFRATKPADQDRSPAQRRTSELVSSCLGSFANFLDNMSFLDSSLHQGDLRAGWSCRQGAGVRDGLSDEAREDPADWGVRESAAEFRATVETLSFRGCQARVSEAWAEAQELEAGVREEAVGRLTLPVAPHRLCFSFSQGTLCEPSIVQTRSKVMGTLLSDRTFSALGNRRTAATDYLPSLRTICRAESLREQGKVKRRFLHYLDSIHLGLPRSTLQLLAADFP